VQTSKRNGSTDPKGHKTARTKTSGYKTYSYKSKQYRVDVKGFLLFPQDWDEDFAEGKAPGVGITGGLTDQHWNLIWFVRNNFKRINQCPTIFVMCKRNCLGLGELRVLFPAGYLRGVCKLAGVTYREAYMQHLYIEDKSRCLDYSYDSKTYATDIRGFLINPSEWDEVFAFHKAYEMKFPDCLTDAHFKIIYYLRDRFMKESQVPTIVETCEDLDIDLIELEKLFPTGYLRGVCKLAGVTYQEGDVSQTSMPVIADDLNVISANKVYTVDVRGFLIDPSDWDEYYATFRAYDMKIPGGKLTDDHWRIINYLRASFEGTKKVPTVYKTCEANKIDLEELEKLFPDGYQRGAVKLAGLRVI